MITAGFGGWLGGRRSQKELKAQHQFERTKALTEHGRDKIGGAISALRFLHRHNQEAADGDLLAPDAEGNEIGKRYDLLAEAIPYIAEARTRKDVELVHSIIGDAWIMERYSNAGSAPRIVSRACRSGLDALGRYLRDEAWEASKDLDSLERAQARAEEIQNEMYEENQASYREWLKEQAAARKIEKTQDADKSPSRHDADESA
ncbi:hypothetical protein [Amycolatopsis sp. cmx-11-32]|uniref:hypothetical protein n=1 Tax=Amycolatopsis sp. cmx-11-32 TaxID=2785796 RepID=UPI0039E6AA42